MLKLACYPTYNWGATSCRGDQGVLVLSGRPRGCRQFWDTSSWLFKSIDLKWDCFSRTSWDELSISVVILRYKLCWDSALWCGYSSLLDLCCCPFCLFGLEVFSHRKASCYRFQHHAAVVALRTSRWSSHYCWLYPLIVGDVYNLALVRWIPFQWTTAVYQPVDSHQVWLSSCHGWASWLLKRMNSNVKSGGLTIGYTSRFDRERQRSS